MCDAGIPDMHLHPGCLKCWGLSVGLPDHPSNRATLPRVFPVILSGALALVLQTH